MPSTASSALRLELMGQGEKSNLWGDITNTNIQILEAAASGFISIPVTSVQHVLPASDYSLGEWHRKVLKFTGTLTANTNVIMPAFARTWILWNATSGPYTLTVKTSAGSGVTVPQGAVMPAFCDGISVIATSLPLNGTNLIALSSALVPNLNADMHDGRQWEEGIEVPHTSGLAEWVKLGTWNAGVAGRRLMIQATGGQGFDNTNGIHQGGVTLLHATIGNNASTGVANIMGAFSFTGNQLLTGVKFVQVGADRTQYDVFVQRGAYSPFSYRVTTSGVWTHVGAQGQSDPGANTAAVRAADNQGRLLNTAEVDTSATANTLVRRGSDGGAAVAGLTITKAATPYISVTDGTRLLNIGVDTTNATQSAFFNSSNGGRFLANNGTVTALAYDATQITARVPVMTDLGALGTAAGSERLHAELYGTTANNDYLSTRHTRVTTGTDWQSAVWRIQRTVDATRQGYIDIGNAVTIGVNSAARLSVPASGGSVTVDGNPVWHAGNDGSGSGLDADVLRGAAPSAATGANTIAQRDTAGNLWSVGSLLQGPFPSLQWRETDGGTDAKNWFASANNGVLSFGMSDDGITVANNWLTVSRSAATPTTAAFGTSLSASSAMQVNGASYPQYVLNETDGPANQRRWSMWINESSGGVGGTLSIGPQNDSAGGTASVTITRDHRTTFAGPMTVNSGATVTGGLTTATPNGLLLKSNTGALGYGLIHRNDGTNYYFLTTAQDDANGSWNSLRPFGLNLATGLVSIGNGLSVNNGAAVNGGLTVAGGFTANTARLGSVTSSMTGEIVTVSPAAGTTGQDAKIGVRNSGDGDGSPNSVFLGVNGSALAGRAYIDTRSFGVAAATPLDFRIGGTINATLGSDGTFIMGRNLSAQYPTQLSLAESTHATSRRTQLMLGTAWGFLQDTAANGTRDFGLYNHAASDWAYTIGTDRVVDLKKTPTINGVRMDVVRPQFNCRLDATSTTNLQLTRRGGSSLFINGVNETIPSAGVNLPTTALYDQSLFFIYAYMNGATMTLEASLTAPVKDTTHGYSIKTGDASRTLVGMAAQDGSGKIVSTSTSRTVKSFYNRQQIVLTSNNNANLTHYGNDNWQNVSNAWVYVLLWDDEYYQAHYSYTGQNASSDGIGYYVNLLVNGVAGGIPGVTTARGAYGMQVSNTCGGMLPTGLHNFGVCALTSGGQNFQVPSNYCLIAITTSY